MEHQPGKLDIVGKMADCFECLPYTHWCTVTQYARYWFVCSVVLYTCTYLFSFTALVSMCMLMVGTHVHAFVAMEFWLTDDWGECER